MLSTTPPPRRLHGISLGHAKPTSNPLFSYQPPLNIGPDLAITSMDQKCLIPGHVHSARLLCMSLRAELVFLLVRAMATLDAWPGLPSYDPK